MIIYVEILSQKYKTTGVDLDKFVDHVASKPFCMLFDLIGASDYLRFPDTESLNSKL